MRYDHVSTHSINCAAVGRDASPDLGIRSPENDGRISSPFGVRASTNAE